MSLILQKYENGITNVFSIGINILNLARSLKSISSELQVLAYNGVVLSAKINTNQGKSLITLSRFLSELPSQIGPELLELEQRASKLADELTTISLKIKKLLQYSFTLEHMIESITSTQKRNNIYKNLNIFSKAEVSLFLNEQILSDADESMQLNIKRLFDLSVEAFDEIEEHFFEVGNAFNLTKNTSEKIKRNAFIADYMGSNILIESAYLDTNRKSFIGFVEDIERIINKLNDKIEDIENRILTGRQKLSRIVK